MARGPQSPTVMIALSLGLCLLAGPVPAQDHPPSPAPKAGASAPTFAPPRTLEDAERLDGIARTYLGDGQPNVAEAIFASIETFLAGPIAARDERALGTLYAWADSLARAGYPDRALVRYRALLELMQDPAAVSAVRQAQVLDAIARTQFDADQIDDARASFEESLSVLNAERSAIAEASKIALGNLKAFFDYRNDKNRTKALLQEFTSSEAFGGRSGLETLLSQREALADLLQAEHLHDAALDQRRLALEEARVSLGLMDVRSIDLMAPLAKHLTDIGRLEEALQLYKALHATAGVADDPRRKFTLISLGSLLSGQKRFDEAEKAFLQALDIMAKDSTPYHYLEATFKSLIDLKLETLEYDEALQWGIKRLTASAALGDGPSEERARALEDLVRICAQGGERRLSEQFAKWWGEDLTTLFSGVELAERYRHMAQRLAQVQQWGSANAFMARYAAKIAAEHGPNARETALAWIAYAKILLGIQQVDEARKLVEKARAILVERRGAGHPPMPEIIDELSVLATLALQDDRVEDAKVLIDEIVAAAQQLYPPESTEFASVLSLRAELEAHSGDLVAAIADAEQATKIIRLHGAKSSLSTTLMMLGGLYEDAKRYPDAISAMNESIALRSTLQGEDSLNNLGARLNLAKILRASGDRGAALALSRETVSTSVDKLPLLERSEDAAEIGTAATLRSVFLTHLDIMLSDRAIPTPLVPEAFSTMQLARRSTASRSLRRGLVQLGLADSTTRGLMRKHLRLTARAAYLQNTLRSIYTEGVDGTPQTEILRQEMDAAQTELTTVRDDLERAAPALAEALLPEPVQAAELSQLLGEKEALLFYLVGHNETFVAVARKTSLDIHVLPIGAAALTEKVEALRISLLGTDSGVMRAPEQPDRSLKRVWDDMSAFDETAARDLYVTIIGSVVDLAADERLVVVPDGPLAAIPFAVLKGGGSFLGLQHAISIIPGVDLLRDRERRTASHAAKPFLGLADPRLSRPTSSQLPETAIADWAERLAPLPETSLEAVTLATTLGATADDVWTTHNATEARLRSVDLSAYRAIAFSTHGLMAGELGLTQPALVLTPGSEGGKDNDGLLTTEEIADMSLDADWVLLSACNTAAGKGGSRDEWLSGLASAFLVAGARSVIVSHWPVPSDATVELTTRMIAAAGQGADLAVAQRKAMVEVSGLPTYAHPRNWAGFSIVGIHATGQTSLATPKQLPNQ